MLFRVTKNIWDGLADNTSQKIKDGIKEIAVNKKFLKLRSIRISPDPNLGIGYLWHYSHFIHDIIMPLIDWLEESQTKAESVHLLIEDTPVQ